MAILGIGCDILSLARLRGVIIRRGADKLAARILSKTEALEYTTARITSPEWTPDRAERFLGTRSVAQGVGRAGLGRTALARRSVLWG